jgi:DNA-binding HxlR family transcriptional regulator
MPKIQTKLAEVPPAPKKKPWPDFTKKFGRTILKAGVTAVPTVLLNGMAELNIKPIQLAILLQMISCWGDKGPHPFPRRSVMMKAIGCDKRTLDRAIAEMVEAGLIEKRKRFRPKRQTSNEYDLTALIERLKGIAVRSNKRREHLKAAREAAAGN